MFPLILICIYSLFRNKTGDRFYPCSGNDSISQSSILHQPSQVNDKEGKTAITEVKHCSSGSNIINIGLTPVGKLTMMCDVWCTMELYRTV